MFSLNYSHAVENFHRLINENWSCPEKDLHVAFGRWLSIGQAASSYEGEIRVCQTCFVQDASVNAEFVTAPGLGIVAIRKGSRNASGNQINWMFFIEQVRIKM